MMIYLFGDYNIQYFWNKISNIKIEWFKDITCAKFCDDKNLINLNNYNFKSNDFIIFSFGNLDFINIDNLIDYKLYINNLINNYLKTIINYIELINIDNINICIHNIIPPIRSNNLELDINKLIYIKYFNKILYNQCLIYNFIFIDIYDHYSDIQGFKNIYKIDSMYLINYIYNYLTNDNRLFTTYQNIYFDKTQIDSYNIYDNIDYNVLLSFNDDNLKFEIEFFNKYKCEIVKYDIYNNQIDQLSNYNNIFMYFNIKNKEYSFFNIITDQQLKSINQMIIIFNNPLDNYHNSIDSTNISLTNKLECIKKINKTHYLIYINSKDNQNILECTYINKKLCKSIDLYRYNYLKKNINSIPNYLIKNNLTTLFISSTININNDIIYNIYNI